MDSADIVAGARGRSLCLSELSRLSPRLTRVLGELDSALGRAAGIAYPRFGAVRPSGDQSARLVEEIQAVDVTPLAAEIDPLRLLIGLGAAVDSAKPWQPPSITDALASSPPVGAALGAAAAAITAAPAAAWCDSPAVPQEVAHWAPTPTARSGRPGPKEEP